MIWDVFRLPGWSRNAWSDRPSKDTLPEPYIQDFPGANVVPGETFPYFTRKSPGFSTAANKDGRDG